MEQLRNQMDESQATLMRQFEAQADARASQRVAELQEQMREFEAHAEARATEKAEAHTKQMMKELAQKEAEAQAMQSKELEAQTEAAAHSDEGSGTEESGSPRAKRLRGD